jgi:hypothetical protein
MMYRLDNNPNAAAQALTDNDLATDLMFCICALKNAHFVGWRNLGLSTWVSLTTCNYAWAYVYLCAIISEHKYRCGDKDMNRYDEYKESLVKAPKDTPGGLETPFPVFVDDFNNGADAVEIYRNYYRAVNSDPAKWTRREPPAWMHLTKS